MNKIILLPQDLKILTKIRRTLHSQAETNFSEWKTFDLIQNYLKDVKGYMEFLTIDEIQPFVCEIGQEKLFKSKVIKESPVPMFKLTFNLGNSGKNVAIRCDMDGLPIKESHKDSHIPFKEGFCASQNMHACGHDAHTACGLALAHWLVDHKEQLSGKFKLLFQPAEEGVRGGRPMAESGQLDDVNWYVAGHVGGACHSNEVQVVTGGFMASSKFDIYFKGLEAHAGSHPHAGHSALSAAACATMMINGIPRHGEGDSRISVGKLIAGSGRNIVAADAMMQMEVRGVTHEVNEFLAQNVQHIIEGVEKAYQVKARIERVGEATTLELCPVLYDKLEQTMHEVDGITVIPRGPGSSGSEDCSWQIRKIVEHGGQAGFFMYGCEHQGHHRPDFDIQDETNMPVALKVFINFAKKVNKPVA